MNSQYAKFPMLTFSFKSSFFYHVFKIVKILHYCYKFMNVFNYRLCDKKWYLMLMLLMNEYIDILYCTRNFSQPPTHQSNFEYTQISVLYDFKN